jgi:hypothetical protein
MVTSVGVAGAVRAVLVPKCRVDGTLFYSARSPISLTNLGRTTHFREIVLTKFVMKKNPFMSLYLSGANRIGAAGRGLLQAAARQQQSVVAKEAGKMVAAFWSGALGKPAARKRTKSGR